MSEQVRMTAKAKVTRKEAQDPSEDSQVTIEFGPDYADGRNAEWAKYTPSLSVTMTVKASVAKHYQQGQPWTLTFTPTEEG